MIKFIANINNTYRTQYKNCDIEVDGNKSYILIKNDNDYDFLGVNGMDEFELTTENGVTNDWSEAEWVELTKAIAALPNGSMAHVFLS